MPKRTSPADATPVRVSYSRTLSPPLSLRCALRCVVLPPPSLRVLALRMPCVQSARSRAFAGDWRGIGVRSAAACPRLQTGRRQAGNWLSDLRPRDGLDGFAVPRRKSPK